jgi:hypothetical protein
MFAQLATRMIYCAAMAGAVGLVTGCSLPNPAFNVVDGTTPGRPGDAGPGTPDATKPADGAVDAPLQPDDGPTPPDVADQPDAPSPPDTPSAPDAPSVPDAPAGADGPSRADGNDAASVDLGLLDGAMAPDGPPVCTAPVLGSGTGLQGEYFDNSDFTGTRVPRIDVNIDWDFGQGSPAGGLDDDNFSVRWTGQLQPVFSGPHTFVASYNDGMRMFLDERVVMYRWGVHITTAEERATVVLEAGRKYDLRFEFFDQGSAALARLAWQNSCQTLQVVPRRQLYPVPPVAAVCPPERAPGTGTGLKVEYFSGQFPTTRLLATGGRAAVDFASGSGAPAPGVPNDDFSARWTGTLEAPIDGPLTIYLSTDDIGRLRFAGAPLLDSWSEPFGPQEVAATVDVRAGQRYDLAVEYWEDIGDAFAHLYWSWPCREREVVPLNRLYPPP